MNSPPAGMLTKNGIQRMFSGEPVQHPILQVLGTIIVHNHGIQCIGVTLSDGEHYQTCYIAMTAVPEHAVALDDFLERFAILKLQKFKSTGLITPDFGMVFAVLVEDMNLLRSGENIGRLGNPRKFVLSKAVVDADERNAIKTIQSQVVPKIAYEAQHAFRWSIWPKGKAPLTPHALSRMLVGGEQVEQPIVQILEGKVISGFGLNRLRLTVTDGTSITDAIWCSKALTHRIDDLGRLVVVRLDKYAFRIDEQERTCVISEMTGLNRSVDLCFSTDLQPRKATLSCGSIAKMLKKWTAFQPIVQVLDFKLTRTTCTTTRSLRLKIFDGLDICSAYLSPQLTNRLLSSGEMFAKASIVRLNTYERQFKANVSRYTCVNVWEMTLLNDGNAVYFAWEDSTVHADALAPTLESGFIARFRAGIYIERPVLQVVDLKMFYRRSSRKSRLRLLLSDGIGLCFAWLPSRWSQLRAELLQLPAVRLDSYRTRTKSSGKLLLNIEEMTGLSGLSVQFDLIADYKSLLSVWVSRPSGYEPEDKILKAGQEL